MHGLGKDSTSTFVSRERRKYAARGEAFPIPERPGRGTAHLTDAQVMAIRMRYAQGGVTDLDLAMQYGISRKTISSLLSGMSYPNAGGPIRPKKANKPGKATREIWGQGQAAFTPKEDQTKEVAA
jgi:DNA-binding CsgD family transcriptional regulator